MLDCDHTQYTLFFVIIIVQKLDKQTTEVLTSRPFTLEINTEREKCIFYLGINLVFYTRVVGKKMYSKCEKVLQVACEMPPKHE